MSADRTMPQLAMRAGEPDADGARDVQLRVTGDGGEVIHTDRGVPASAEFRERFLRDAEAKAREQVPGLVTDTGMRSLGEQLQRLAVVPFVADGGDEGDEPQATNVVDRLIQIGMRGELFHDARERTFTTIDENGRRPTYAVASGANKAYLKAAYYREFGQGASPASVDSAVGTLSAIAQFEGPQHAVHVRVAEHEGRVYLDAGGESWRVIEVSASGWRYIDSAPVRFVRYPGMLPLVEPIPGGDIDAVFEILNVHREGARRLLKAYLPHALLAERKCPLLVLHGEAGSAKSSTASTLKAILDPHESLVRAPPTTEKDLMVSAQRERVTALDNLSRISQQMSDALCRLYDGAAFISRQLFTDSEESVLRARTAVILTGIECVARETDLLDRSLLLPLERITEDKRRTERQLETERQRVLPDVLGGVLDLLVRVLAERDRPSDRPLPRIADFAETGLAVERALGWEPGTFESDLAANATETHAEAIEANPIAPAVLRLLESEPFEGTATELLAALTELQFPEPAKPPRSWPQTPQKLTAHLTRAMPDLRSLGVERTDLPRERQRRRFRLAINARGEHVTHVTSSPCHPETGSNHHAGAGSAAGDKGDKVCGRVDPHVTEHVTRPGIEPIPEAELIALGRRGLVPDRPGEAPP